MSGMRQAISTRGLPRAALAAAVFLAWSASARADDGAYAVHIDSEPPGATVTTGDGEELGKTPLEGVLPAGVHTLVFERRGYETGVDVIEVRARSEPQSFSMSLMEAAYGAIEVTAEAGAPALDGAEVWVDGEKLGEGSGRIRVPAGPHHVEISKPGYEAFEVWIEVSEADTVEVVAALQADPDAAIATEEPSPPRPEYAPPLVVAGGGIEFGGRTFRYSNPQSQNLRPYNAGGVPLLRMVVELYPLSRTGSEWLTGLAIVGSGGRAFPVDSTTEDGDRIGTSWSEYDIAARALLPVATDVRAGLEAGHGRARFGFDDAGDLADEVPDVDYRYARVGAIAAAGVGRYDVMGSLSVMSPYEAGRTAERFADASVWGLGLEASIGSSFARHFDARLSAHYTRLAYTLDAEPGAPYQADGGSDHFFGLSLGGYVRY